MLFLEGMKNIHGLHGKETDYTEKNKKYKTCI